MKCKRVIELVVEFEDATLPVDVVEHMEQCASCRQYHRRMKTVRQLVAFKKYERADPGFEERSALAIHRRIENAHPQPKLWFGNFWEFLLGYPLSSLRYILVAATVSLFLISFISMPRLRPILSAEPAVRLRPPLMHTPMVSFEAYPQPTSMKFNQNFSNHGPIRIEYGPREESIPVNYTY